MKLLLADDHNLFRDALVEYIMRADHKAEIAVAKDYYEAIEIMDKDAQQDLVLLDLTMPGMDGLDVLRQLRVRSQVPVLLLTARGDQLDRIVGLEVGADDYMSKPFHPRELSARIDAILRRVHAPQASEAVVVAGPIRVDLDRRRVTVDGQHVELTSTEFDLLRVLVTNAGRVMERETLMEKARGEEFASFDRSVDVHISNLRRKIGDRPGKPVYIQTVRSIGYVVPREPEMPP